jgi:hypothetical protein
MNPPGQLEQLRDWIVSAIQTFPDFATAQAGYKPLTTFVNGNPLDGVADINPANPVGIPNSAVFGKVKGLLISAIEEALTKVGVGIGVFINKFSVEDDQTAKPLFRPVGFAVVVAEAPNVNQTVQGTGLPILFLVERLVAALKYKPVPDTITNPGTGLVGNAYYITGGSGRNVATADDDQKGRDIWQLDFQVDLSTPIRTDLP